MTPTCETSSSLVLASPSSSMIDEGSESHHLSCRNEEIIPTSQPENFFARRNSEADISLKCLLKQIEKEKKDQLWSIKFVRLTTRVCLQIAKEERLKTALKCSAMTVAILCLHPTLVGSIACLSGYRIGNYNDLYSLDLNTTTTASILFSNMGQGITFLIQEIELALIPSFLLFKNVFNRAKCQIIRDIYSQYILSVNNKEVKALLYEEANHELARWNGFMAETDEIDVIMKEIAQDKEKRLSYRNILCMTAHQFIRKAKKFPLTTIVKVSCIGITALALHPVIIGLIGCLDSYRAANPNDLYSPDSAVLGNAINVFSNTGHVVEYAFSGLGLLAGTASLLFDHKKVIRKIIKEIYDTRIQMPSLSEQTKKFLREKKHHDLTPYT